MPRPPEGAAPRRDSRCLTRCRHRPGVLHPSIALAAGILAAASLAPSSPADEEGRAVTVEAQKPAEEQPSPDPASRHEEEQPPAADGDTSAGPADGDTEEQDPGTDHQAGDGEERPAGSSPAPGDPEGTGSGQEPGEAETDRPDAGTDNPATEDETDDDPSPARPAAPLNMAPTITFDHDRAVVTAPFDPLDGVTATDLEDGDLTADVVVTGGVGTEPGEYVLIYTVTDSGGASVSAARTVVVVEPNTAPTITIDGPEQLTVAILDEVDPVTDARAFDEEDGDLTHALIWTLTDTGPERYTITYEVTDSGGLTTVLERAVVIERPDPQRPPEPTPSRPAVTTTPGPDPRPSPEPAQPRATPEPERTATEAVLTSLPEATGATEAEAPRPEPPGADTVASPGAGQQADPADISVSLPLLLLVIGAGATGFVRSLQS